MSDLSKLLEANILTSLDDKEGSLPNAFSLITGLDCIQATLDRIQTLRDTSKKGAATTETFCLDVSSYPDGSSCMTLKSSGRLVRLNNHTIERGPNGEIFLALLQSVNIKVPLLNSRARGLELAASILMHLPKSMMGCPVPNLVPCTIAIPILHSELVAVDFLSDLQGLLAVLLERQFDRCIMGIADLNIIRMVIVQSITKRTSPADIEVKIYGIRGFRLSLRVTDASEQTHEKVYAIISKVQRCLDDTRKKDILERLWWCARPIASKIFRLILPEEAIFARYRTAAGIRPHLNIDELGLFSGDPERGRKYDITLFQVSEDWRDYAAITFREHTKLILHEDLQNCKWRSNIRAIDRALGGNLLWRQGGITCRLRLAPRVRRDNYEEYCYYDESADKVMLGNISQTSLSSIKQLLTIRVWDSHHRLTLRTPEPPVAEDIATSKEDLAAHEYKMTLEFLLISRAADVPTLSTTMEIELFPPRLLSGRASNDEEKALKQYKLAVHAFLEEQVGHEFSHSRRLLYKRSLNGAGVGCEQCHGIACRRRGVERMTDRDETRLFYPRTYPVKH